MKNRLLPLLMLLLVATLSAEANPVDMRTAREVGFKFLNANAKTPLRGTDDLQLATTYKTESGMDALHVFNTPNGFVIVSADDCATPILGYSDEGRPFDTNNVPIQLQGYLQGFVEQIQYGIENHVQDENTLQQWEMVQATGRLNNNRDGETVEPLITANWGQGCYYNAMCPEDENGQCGHVPTGCVATAMGMIMNYWGFPTHGNGSHTYTPYGYPAQTANFSETTYDWGNMPDELTDTSSQVEIDAVSTLLWHCGVSMDMGYAVGGSGAFVQDMRAALNDVFNYNCNQVEQLGVDPNITTNQWFAKIKSNLDEGMPILYSGSTSDYLGHAWVCDGYDADSLLHFNWGWNGSGNGYFAIGASNVFNYEFNADNQTIFDISPQCDANSVIHVTASVNDSLAGYVIGAGEYGCEYECTLTAIANEGYHFVKWIEFWDGIPSYFGGNYTVSIDSNYTFFLTHDRWLTAVFAEDGEGCNLVFDIYDSGGDGLNGGGLEVYYGDGSWERLSFGSGSCASFTREFLNNSHVMIWWSLGNGWGEYSYVVRFENGAVIHHNLGITEYFTFNSYEFDLNCEDQFTPRSITADINPENSGIVTGGGVYNPGDTCTLSAIPNQGHYFACWEENGEIMSTDSTMTFIVGIIDRHFTAHFGPYQIVLFSSLEEGGYVNGGGTFNYGDTCTIHAVPNEGYVFMYWTENGNVVSCSDEYSFVVMNDMDLVAVFATEDSVCNITLYFDGFNWKGHAMTVDYGNGVSEVIRPEEWTPYPSYSRCVYDGNHITISWTNGGYTWGFSFDIRYGNGTMIYHGEWGDNSLYEFDVNCDWAYVFYDIAAVASPTEGGTIYGTGSFHWGTTCTLTATPNEGYDFLYWSENGILVSWDEQYAFTVNDNRHLMAHFSEQSATYCNMVFELGGDDDIWIPGNLLKVNYGDGVTEQLTTEWDQNHFTTGYACFSRPIRNGNQITLGFVEDDSYTYCVLSLHYEDGDTTYRITSLDNNFHCVFNANCEDAVIDETYSIIVTANFSDGGSVEGGGQYPFGQVCTLTATPEENYIFAYWAKDGILVSYSPTYSFNAVENANYEAVFMKGVLIGKNFTGMGTGLPSESIANYSFSKQIYTFDEIAMTGVIERIAFYSSETAGHPKTRNYEVYLTHADIDSFDSGDVPFSEGDMVFSGEVTMGVDRWSVIELSTPFYYNGIDNLVLLVIDNTNIQDGGLICRVFDTEKCQAISGWSDETPFSVSNRDCGRGLYYKNQVFFGGEFTAIPPRTITITANPETGGTVSGAGTYNFGTVCTLKATANAGYIFINWTENGEVVSTEDIYSFTVTGDRSLVANFFDLHWTPNTIDYEENMPVTAVVEIDGVEQQSTTLELGAFSGEECRGSQMAMYFEPTQRYIYQMTVFGEEGDEITFRLYDHATNEELDLVAPEAIVFDAFGYGNLPNPIVLNFRHSYDINTTANPAEGGTVNGGGTYFQGETATLTATANTGYHFVNWTKDGEIVPIEATYSFEVTSGGDYVANFALNTYEITATANPAIGGTIAGAGIYEHFSTCTLTATPNTNYVFVNWTLDGEVVSTEAEYSFEVTSGGDYVARFDLVQTTNFSQGWNWWSTYIEQEGTEGLEALENGLGANGSIVKAQNEGYVSYLEGYGWYGSLERLYNEQSYRVQANAACTMQLQGLPTIPADHPITLNPGWTWMGFPWNQAMSVEAALEGFEPEANDFIKGRNAYTMYYAENGYSMWFGPLNSLEPGQGYVYYSNSGEAKTLTLNTNDGRSAQPNVTASDNLFRPEAGDYADNMTLTAVVDFGGTELRSEDYEVAAFCNGECRGSAKLTYFAPTDSYITFLTLYGNDGDELEFVLTDGDMTALSGSTLHFATDGRIGTLSEPYPLCFGFTGLDDNAANRVSVYPNPSRDVFNVKGEGIRRIDVFNAFGQVVFSAETSNDTFQVDLSDKATGVYLLRVVTESGVTNQQLIKE